ncbi:UNVERIFIED_ORG: capsular polysaccharide biosynthesis protein [Methylorubrum zatmanii]|jgi:capsular polysaccharide biosynthesis protein
MSIGNPFNGMLGYSREILSEKSENSRNSAIFVYDETGSKRGADLSCPKMLPASEISMDVFPRGSGARGTILVTLPNNEVLFPRITDDEASRKFYDYLCSVNDPCNKESQYFANFHIAEGGMVLDDMSVRYMDEDILWVTPDEPFNWGMWLLQTLPAIHLAECRDFTFRLLCVQEANWQAEFIRFFAPSMSERVIKQDLDKHYLAKKNLGTVCRSQRNMFLTDFDRSVFKDVAAAKGSAKSPVDGEKIFISRKTRSELNPNYRALINEAEVIAALEGEGFTAIEPEKYSFADQIAIFRDAKLIVGLGGAGMFNSVFCKEDALIVTIENSTNWVEAHANLFSSSGLAYGVYFGTPVPEDSGLHKRWNVRSSDLVNEIRKIA